MPAQSATASSVCLLALPETTPTSLYGLLEVFSAVGVSWNELTGESVHVPPLAPRIVSRDGKPFTSIQGMHFTPACAITDVERCDIAIVTDLALGPEADPRGRWPEETAWMRAQLERGAIVCSVCTGALFLAEAGMLDGLDATTHWGATAIFSRCYPRVRLVPERILCPTGPDQRIVTGGGSSAWADLALYLVARTRGAAEAVRIAKIFVLGDHADGQLPFTAMNRHRYHEDGVIGRCQAWIAEHYVEPNPVARMVEYSGLAARTFKRRFRQATGYTPVDYVQALRVEEAKQWLEASDEPVDAIAHKVGYEDPAYFRKLFKRRTGITPGRYRQRFQSISRLGR
ncbi:MAG TPA: helix-turn-helix domain-containing protein [Woeseiaceae bacterium]|nr:helix-turn-helix domain-containing protein [Woeseiaceae bacterium]